MAHEIDANRSAMYARKPAWHKLGVVKDGWFTADEALTEAFMDFEVIKVPVVAMHGTEAISTDEWCANVRKSPHDGTWQVLGITSPDRGEVQPRECFRFMDEVVGQIGGAHYETAGVLRQGKQLFMTVDTGAIVLDVGGREDQVQKYILLVNSYDGSQAFRVKMTNVRVECANLLALALRGSSNEIVNGDWSTKHTRQIMNRVAMAKTTLGLWREYNDRWASAAELMIETDLTDNQFAIIVKDLFTSEVEGTGIKETDDEKILDVRMIYETSSTCDKVHGTVWGGLQAVTEWADWRTKVRGGTKTSADEMRFRRQLEDGAELKQTAWDKFYDLVEA